MLLVDDLAAGGTKNLRHTPRGLVTLVMTEMHFILRKKKLKKYHARSCQNVCDVLTFLLDNILIRFGTNLYR